MSHIIFGPDGSGHFRNATRTWAYYSTANWEGEREEGLVSVIFEWKGWETGRAKHCQGSWVIPYDICMAGMRMLVDGCNTESADHKLGDRGKYHSNKACQFAVSA
ncbi:hypothetical protein LTR95_016701 [Oleoguttula sp. CCFEE 5521]